MPEIIVKLGDNIVHKHFLYKDAISVGRSPENEIAIENLAVSRRHATIRKINGNYVLEDHGSANGTYVNGVRVTKTEIQDNDVITIGKHKLHFYNHDAPVEAAPPAIDFAQKTMLVQRQEVASPRLRIMNGKQKDEVHELRNVETRIGRAPDNDVRLNDWFVSKHHAVIVRRGQVYVVRDLASWRHTLVNGLIIQEQPLKYGDEIQFGPKITAIYEAGNVNELDHGSGRMPVEIQSSIALSKAAFGRERLSSASPVNWIDEPKKSEASDIFQEASQDEPVVEEGFKPESVEVESVASVAAPEPEEFPHTAVFSVDDLHDSRHAQSSTSEPAFSDEVEPAHELAEEAASEPMPWDEEPATASESVESAPEEKEIAAPVASNGYDAHVASPVQTAAVSAVQSEDEAQSVAAEMSSVAGQLSGADPNEVAMWTRALLNPSKAIRKQAQRKLKVLTGRDYDIE